MKQQADKIVLSLFPGIGLLDRAFEDAGFCVVRGPDRIWGGDVRKFNPPEGHFSGVIGGPPCQDFSKVRRTAPTGEGLELVGEFLRIATTARDWWLMENVPGSPTVTGPGWVTQVFTLDASHRGESQPTCLASEGRRAGRRSWAEFCRLQGMPEGFDLEPFTVAAKYRAVGNGVPYPMALTVAQAIKNRDRGVTPHRVCECGCGLFVTGRQRLATAACRKRMERRRPVTEVLEMQLGL